VVTAVSPLESPNRARKLFFLGWTLASSLSFTSSNPSSSLVGASKVLLLNVDRVGYLVDGRESNEDREVKLSAWNIGERPEMSKDLLYDSKNSREIEKGSLSLRHRR